MPPEAHRVHKTKPEPPPVDLRELVGLFYDPVESLGEFRRCLTAQEVPQPQRDLLNHHAHMTVTVEAFHDCPVEVRVARTLFSEQDHSAERESTNGAWYAREITLHRQTDHAPVQYGIVRLFYELLAPKVWKEIESQSIPLGRVLINHNVLREVELCELWEVNAGAPLADLIKVRTHETVFGRTARIFCDGRPAIELLEIVTPTN